MQISENKKFNFDFDLKKTLGGGEPLWGPGPLGTARHDSLLCVCCTLHP